MVLYKLTPKCIIWVICQILTLQNYQLAIMVSHGIEFVHVA